MNFKILLTIFFTPIFLITGKANSQQLPVGDPIEAYYRLLSTELDQSKTPSFFIRPIHSLQLLEDSQTTHPWQHITAKSAARSKNTYHIVPLIPSVTVTNNNLFPVGQNDGALWQSRGYNYTASIGAYFEYGPFQVTFRPKIGYSSNRDFDLPPASTFPIWPLDNISEFNQGLSRIDMPHRFGEDSFSWFHPGQSTASLNYWGVSAGVSTANNWTGPALYNPLIMSNNAPGFFHGFLETDGPYQTKYGNFEARLFWGGLKESDWYDENPDNNLRFISGLEFNYSLPFLPELSVGFARTFVEQYPDEGLAFNHFLRPFNAFTEDNFSEDRRDTAINLTSFFARWVIPNQGFEVWAEWGKNENTDDKRNFLLERVHTRSYILGLQKRFEIPKNRWITLNTEITQIENLENTGGADYPVWYEHLYIPQGYTHQGQVLGAGIGPGSNSQKIRIDFYDRLGLLGISANRIVFNNDRLYRHQSHINRNQERIVKDHWDHNVPQYASAHDLNETEFRFGGHLVLFLPYNIEIQGDIYRSLILNRYNIYEDDISNVNVQFSVRFQLPGMAR